ncbi:uncharacterized protein LOC119840587 [Zerene cesonia]|uniref:uncharacterized protein LOC119840587 n=1 Tax=Zerene cesonia TaxID=33412 RepID=UPI0018E54FF0|nr:uncharacterized protein LOC119840587 [Zerene cesonia]
MKFDKFIKKHIKTVGKNNVVDDIFTSALFYQQIFGQQILDPNWTWKKYFVRQMLMLFLFIYVFLGTLQCLKINNDAELLAEACYTIIMIVIFPLKMGLFIKSRLIFRSLYVSTKTTLVDVIRSDSSVDIESILKNGNKIVLTLFFMVITPCCVYELTTLWNYITGQRTLLSRSTMILMPMTTPYFEIAWFLHTIFLFEISSTIILDMWFVVLIYFMCSALKSLANMLKLDEKSYHESKEGYANRLENALRTFYGTHLKLNKFLITLCEMYKISAFIPLCNAAICICLILLLMSKEVNWRFAPHMLPMFAEIFAYNWFGEQIKTKMNDVRLALLYFDWNNLRAKDKKSYYIMMTYMTKDFGIKTISGKDLSLITMTAVLKISYQAFTVLQTIDG